MGNQLGDPSAHCETERNGGKPVLAGNPVHLIGTLLGAAGASGYLQWTPGGLVCHSMRDGRRGGLLMTMAGFRGDSAALVAAPVDQRGSGFAITAHSPAVVGLLSRQIRSGGSQ